ncbi:MAG: hypothetical protein MI924_25850 [Chloroflexales bacterium]|nr:hypothetical protein [Chloroflexales bacterium]
MGSHTYPCSYRIDSRTIIGFEYDRGIGLYWEATWHVVAQARAAQRQPIQYSSAAVQQQLDNDGLVVECSADRLTKTIRNPAIGKVCRVLALSRLALPGLEPEPEPESEPELEPVTNVTNDLLSMVTDPTAPVSAKIGLVTDVTIDSYIHEGQPSPTA